jgi:hypothetical protein
MSLPLIPSGESTWWILELIAGASIAGTEEGEYRKSHGAAPGVLAKIVVYKVKIREKNLERDRQVASRALADHCEIRTLFA